MKTTGSSRDSCVLWGVKDAKGLESRAQNEVVLICCSFYIHTPITRRAAHMSNPQTPNPHSYLAILSCQKRQQPPQAHDSTSLVSLDSGFSLKDLGLADARLLSVGGKGREKLIGFEWHALLIWRMPWACGGLSAALV